MKLFIDKYVIKNISIYYSVEIKNNLYNSPGREYLADILDRHVSRKAHA